MAVSTVTVTVEGSLHKCKETHTHVKPNDVVQWSAGDRKLADGLIIFFLPETPFETHGPIHDGDVSKVRPDSRLGVYVPMIFLDGKLLKTEGDIVRD